MVIFTHFLPDFIVETQKNSRLRRAMYYFQVYIIGKTQKNRACGAQCPISSVSYSHSRVEFLTEFLNILQYL